MILENLAIYFQLFDVSISQWSVANNESELYRLVSICNKPVNYLFYIINPAIKNLRAQKPIHVLIRFIMVIELSGVQFGLKSYA